MPSRPILVVDDEPVNLAAMRQVIGDQYPAVYARDGQGAIEAARKHQPALILLDIQMPDMDGYEVCRRLKADPETQDIPLIFVTSLAETGHEAAGFAVGAVDYIIKPVSPPIVLARIRTHLSLVRATRLERSYLDAITMLGELGHYHDEDTGVHIWRMASYAQALARAIGWSPDQARLLELAAPMHDTGKVAIPESILRKPGKLDDAQWQVMKTHTQIGHDILVRSSAEVFRLAAEVALCHHEKWDGSGYPAGKAGESIPQSARIVAIADVFDALSMKRSYKDPWPLDQIVATLKEGSGRHFDPTLLEVFLSILPEILAIQADWEHGRRQPGGVA